MNTTTLGTTIVAFHIGRGGQFHNPGYLSYIGEKSINDFTDDLFLRYENSREIVTAIEEIEDGEEFKRLYAMLQEAECGVSEAREELSKRGYSLTGDPQYYDGAGNEVGLTFAEAETGVGRINIDHGYDTTYAQFVQDCSDEELKLIIDSEQTWTNAYQWVEANRADLLPGNEPEHAQPFHDLHSLFLSLFGNSESLDLVLKKVENNSLTYREGMQELYEFEAIQLTQLSEALNESSLDVSAHVTNLPSDEATLCIDLRHAEAMIYIENKKFLIHIDGAVVDVIDNYAELEERVKNLKLQKVKTELDTYNGNADVWFTANGDSFGRISVNYRAEDLDMEESYDYNMNSIKERVLEYFDSIKPVGFYLDMVNFHQEMVRIGIYVSNLVR